MKRFEIGRPSGPAWRIIFRIAPLVLVVVAVTHAVAQSRAGMPVDPVARGAWVVLQTHCARCHGKPATRAETRTRPDSASSTCSALPRIRLS